MNDKDNQIGQTHTALPLDRILASIGIALLMHSETLFEYVDDLDGRTALDISNDLYIFSSMLAAVLTQYEHRLSTLTVGLPKEVGAITVVNPLYEGETEEPVDKSTGSARDELGDLPF